MLFLGKTKSTILFNAIAPFYGLFYSWQKKRFVEVLSGAQKELGFSPYITALDVGCGTGALSGALSENGLHVTGIDPAENMLGIARRKNRDKEISFIRANVLDGLPFADNSFDISIASYVAHGMKAPARQRMYAEMNRVAHSLVIIYDYNQHRSPLTSILESLEFSDYFHFIKTAESEMKAFFQKVKVVQVAPQAACYICMAHE